MYALFPHPEVYINAHEERSRIGTQPWKDRAHLPYLNVVRKEALRGRRPFRIRVIPGSIPGLAIPTWFVHPKKSHGSTNDRCVPHVNQNECEYNVYHIPKGSYLHATSEDCATLGYTTHLLSSTPDRFLNGAPPERTDAFGYGRVCPPVTLVLQATTYQASAVFVLGRRSQNMLLFTFYRIFRMRSASTPCQRN
jgi:hypothetical protein